MEIIVLGSGSAKPIPREDRCEQCLSKDRRDRRLPSALLIDGKFLIDAPPEIEELLKMVNAQIAQIEGIITTHNHQDAAGGLGYIKSRGAQVFPHPMWKVKDFEIAHGKTKAKGFLVDDTLLYCSDYSNINPALTYLKKAKIAFLDGSGWDRVFPSHQPMVEVIPVVKRLQNLRQIYFTHNGHTRIPHRELEKMVQKLGDRRFKLAYHGMKIKI